MMIVPRSQGVLNHKCIFRKKKYFQRRKNKRAITVALIELKTHIA